jgi:hypothetical protein
MENAADRMANVCKHSSSPTALEASSTTTAVALVLWSKKETTKEQISSNEKTIKR